MRRTNSSSNLVILMFLVEQNVLVEDKVTNRVGYCGNACNKVKGGTSKIQDIIVASIFTKFAVYDNLSPGDTLLITAVKFAWSGPKAELL